MIQLCEINQIGPVGKIKEVGPNLTISVASDASYKKDGEWQERTNWIEHKIFARQEGTLKWAREDEEDASTKLVRVIPRVTAKDAAALGVAARTRGMRVPTIRLLNEALHRFPRRITRQS